MKSQSRASKASKAKGARPPFQQSASNGFAGKPLDGSQYVDVIEEQEYADRRPSEEEQKPRYSYLRSVGPNSGK